MKRMGWDDQMRDLKAIDRVHVQTRDRWRWWDGMIRWEPLKQLTGFTYKLETDEEDGMGWSDERSKNNWPISRTCWRRMKRMGWDDQMRDLKTIDQVHVLAGDGWRGWSDDQMKDLKTIDQVHVLAGDGWRGWDGMIRWEILKQLTKFTYALETDEEDGMGWSDERS